MKKFLITALAATSMFTVASGAAAAVTVNFSFKGDLGNTLGIVNGKLVFNTTGTNVAASEVYILGAPAGTIDAGSVNQNLLNSKAYLFANAFTVSGEGVVTAALLSLSTENSLNTYIELNNARNGNASQLYNYSNDLYTFSVAGFSGLTFTPVVTATAAVPEPATWALMMFGFGGIGFAMRRRSKITTRVRFA